jgi:hypothetical protein
LSWRLGATQRIKLLKPPLQLGHGGSKRVRNFLINFGASEKPKSESGREVNQGKLFSSDFHDASAWAQKAVPTAKHMKAMKDNPTKCIKPIKTVPEETVKWKSNTCSLALPVRYA